MPHVHPLRRLFPWFSPTLFLLGLSLTARTQCPPDLPLSPPWLQPPAQPYAHWTEVDDGSWQRANVYVMSTALPGFRPFVFVEGIDFGSGTEDGGLRHGDFGWHAFLGCNSDQYPMMAQMPDLLDEVVQRGYTPVLIDFEQGSGELFTNAQVLADILAHLRDARTDLRPMVVSGASMGGQLGRIALRMMETQGATHCTGLFISLDSPHRGANVPMGLQHLIHFLSGEGIDNMTDLSSALMSPAARQLLFRQVPSLTPRIQYQDAIDALGLPHACRNIAIANGASEPLSGTGEPLLMYDHALLETDWPGDIGPLFHLEIHPVPGDPDHAQAMPGQPVLTAVEWPEDGNWPWPLTPFVAHGFSGAQWPTPEPDLAPGGTRPSMQQFAAAFNAGLDDADLPLGYAIPGISDAEFQALHSFIPTASALDIPPPWPEGPIPSSLLVTSPFDAVHVPLTNEPHSEINAGNRSFLIDELDRLHCPLSPGQPVGDTLIARSPESTWPLSAVNVEGHLILHATDSTLSAEPAAAGTHGHFKLAACTGDLIVESSGQLTLGGGAEETGFASATLVLPHGTFASVQGTLTLHSGSHLEVESGATLRFEGGMLDMRTGSSLTLQPGGRIEMGHAVLWAHHGDAMASINGAVILDDETEWTCHFAGEARWTTQSTCHFQCGGQADWTLSSAVDATRWLLSPHAHATVSGDIRWSSQGVGLRLLGNARMDWDTQKQEWWDAPWIGTPSDTVQSGGQVRMAGSEQRGLTWLHENGPFLAQDRSFEGGFSRHTNVRLNLSLCSFDAHPIEHIQGSATGPDLIQDCVFQSGLKGVTSIGMGTLRVEDSDFLDLAIGLEGQNTRLELSCNRFSNNDIGLMANRSHLGMNATGGGGWNRFENNDTHLRFLLAPLPDIIGGANHFGAWSSGWAQGTLSLGCNPGGAVDIDITGQSWNWPSGWPQIQTGLSSVGPGGSACPIEAVDLAPVSEEDCPTGGGTKRE